MKRYAGIPILLILLLVVPMTAGATGEIVMPTEIDWVHLISQSPVLVFAWLVWKETSRIRVDLDRVHSQIIDLLSDALDRTGERSRPRV